MSECYEMTSFELNDKNLINDWITLSKEIDEDIAKADGFIARDSGIDKNGRVYCLVRWQSKTHQQNFMKELESREEWTEMMAYFGSIANMETAQNQTIELFKA